MKNLVYVASFNPMDAASVAKLPGFLAYCNENGIAVDVASSIGSDATATTDKPSNKKADKADKAESKKKADKAEKEYKAPEDHKLLISAGYEKGLVTLSVSDNEGGVYAFLPSDIRQAFNKWLKATFPGIAYDTDKHIWSVKATKKQWEASSKALNDRCQFVDDGGLVFTVTAAERQTVRDGWHKSTGKAE